MLFLLVILLFGGTLVVRQRAIALAVATRGRLRVGQCYEFQSPDFASQGEKVVAVEMEAEPADGRPAAVRFEDVQLRSTDGRQQYALHEVTDVGAMFEPVRREGDQPPEKALLLFEVPESFREGKLHYWGVELAAVRLKQQPPGITPGGR